MEYLKSISTKAIICYLLLCGVLLQGCGDDGSKYDGLILTDTKTGRQYLLKYTGPGDTYFIDEKVIKIIGKDTTEVWD